MATDLTVVTIVLILMSFWNACHSFDQSQIDAFINKALACHQTKNPGLTVSVVKDGLMMFARGYGVSDLKTGRKVENTTLFGLASLSKAFAATLMVKLLRDRGMSIYTKPADILSEGFQFEDAEFTNYASVRDLMVHCLGVPPNQGMRMDTNLTRREVARRIRYFAPIHKFRVHYLYSNQHFGILTYLAEVLGGKPWEDLIAQYIYGPLGMTGSSFMTRADRQVLDVAQGYAHDDEIGRVIPVPEEVNKLWGVYGGSTGIMSNSLDISKWMLMQLNNGKDENGNIVIGESDLSNIHSAQTPIQASTVEKYFHRPLSPFTVTEVTYAMGWKNGFYKGYRILRHTGTTFGYSSLITLIPEVNLGIFSSMTGEDEQYIFRTLLHSYLADTFLGETPTINETTICTYPEPWFPAVHTSHRLIDKTRNSTHSLSAYVGTYHHPAYGDLVVRPNSTHLQMDYGVGHWILYPESTTNRFSGEAFGLMWKLWDLTHVTFHMGSTPHTVEVPGFEPREPPIFTKSSSHPGPSIVG